MKQIEPLIAHELLKHAKWRVYYPASYYISRMLIRPIDIYIPSSISQEVAEQRHLLIEKKRQELLSIVFNTRERIISSLQKTEPQSRSFKISQTRAYRSVQNRPNSSAKEYIRHSVDLTGVQLSAREQRLLDAAKDVEAKQIDKVLFIEKQKAITQQEKDNM